MRTRSSISAVTVAVAASVLLAPAAYATAPGDNGNVKIHKSETAQEVRANQPHVCTFYLDGFKFDGAQEVTWQIVEMPPTGTKGTVAKEGAVTLDSQGNGRTEDIQLPDGHYKLIWNFEGEKGAGKHKVFWTNCDENPPIVDGPEVPIDEVPEEPELPGGWEPPTEEEPELPEGGGEESEAPEEGPLPEGGGEETETPAEGEESESGDLAETGSSAPVGAIAAAAAALLGAGGYLVFRRRKAGQN